MKSEFQYEKEIQLDEKRIAGYYDALPLFLDLPGESEAIRDRLCKKFKEKVCSFEELDTLRRFVPAWNRNDGDEENISDTAEYSAAEELLDMIDKVIVDHAERFALNQNVELNDKFLKVICQGGKTLARVSDLLYTPADDKAAVIVLAKRSIADIGDFAESIADIGDCPEMFAEIEILQNVRQKILNILFRMQQENS